MSSPPEDDPLETVTRYITGVEARYALQEARLRRIEEEGGDTSRAARVLHDLEQTLSVLRQRHWSLTLDVRSRRLLASAREKLARSRPQPPSRPARRK